MKLNLLKCMFGFGKFLGFMVNQKGIKANSKKILVLLDMTSPQKPKKIQSLTRRVEALSRCISKAIDCCLPFFNVLIGSKRFEWNEECEQAFSNLKKHLETLLLLSKPVRASCCFYIS